MLILNHDDVRRALPMTDAIAAMRWAYAAASTGQANVPPRIHLRIPDTSAVSLFMPAYVAANREGGLAAALTVKAVSVFPDNIGRGLASIQGAVLVLDPETGRCLALMDGAVLTAIRTGAGSAVATDVLARHDSTTLAILGAGAQAATQLEAVCVVRCIKTVFIYNRTFSRAQRLAAAAMNHVGKETDIRVMASASEAVRSADILCTATNASEPLFADVDVQPGTHINAIGSFRPDMQEIPAETVQRSRVYVDSRTSALADAGDLIQPIMAGLINKDHISGEIGALMGEPHGLIGRQNAADITLFKSVGIAVQDAVAATIALSRAQAIGIGQPVTWTDHRP